MTSIIRACFWLFLLCIFYVLINFFTANTYNKVVISGIFSDDTSLKLFHTKNTHGFTDTLSSDADVIGSLEEQKVIFKLDNPVVHKLKLSVDNEAQVISKPFMINSISLYSFFYTEPAHINLENLNDVDQFSIDLTENNLDAHLSFFVSYVLPFFLAIIFYLLITSLDWLSFLRSIPAISDLYGNQGIRNKDNLVALDGLRGIAALAVLLEHTMWQFTAMGRAGVWLFFVLSGFLLIRPFVLFPEKMFTYKGVRNYLIKRIKRILPMFYFMVTVVFLLDEKVDIAVRHYLLVQGDGYFWTILHEFYFYILLPFITYFLYFLFRKKYIYILLSLVALSLTWYFFASLNFISLYGLGVQHVPFFYIFFIGMAGGYFYYGFFQNSEKFQAISTKYSGLFSVTAIFIALSFFLFSANISQVGFTYMVFKLPLVSAFIAITLVLLSVISNERSLYNRVLSLSIFRLIGIVGYSFYLVHPSIIMVFDACFSFMFAVSPKVVLPSVVRFICTFVVT